jgi:hypothetical protein
MQPGLKNEIRIEIMVISGFQNPQKSKWFGVAGINR